MRELLSITVTGLPVAQGSMSGFVVKTKAGATRAIVTDQKRTKLKPWREAIRSDAVAALDQQEAHVGPVAVRLHFALPKPAGAPKRRRVWPIGKRAGDIDKLTRGVLDALTDSAVFVDDSQVISLFVTKNYPGESVQTPVNPGVSIDVIALDETDFPTPEGTLI